jgi:hypothetical protein
MTDPINWEQLLRERLRALGATDAAKLTPAQLAEFKHQVFWAANRVGISDPAAWIAERAQGGATAAAAASANLRPLVETGQRKSAEREPVTLENSPATTSAASPPRPVARMFAWGTTKAEALSGAKAAIEAGESPRTIAERLAFAHEHFHASQREISRAVGRSASSVNRLLNWRRSGYNGASPFGPRTRAERAAHRRLRSRNNKRAAPTGLRRETSSPDIQQDGDDGNVTLVPPHCFPPHQQASPAASAIESHPSGPTHAALALPNVEAATRETKGPTIETLALEDPALKRGRSGSRQDEKNRPSAKTTKTSQKRTPERMRMVIDALTKNPILDSAARTAGLHPNTVTNWLKASKSGHEGFDLEHQREQWRFHEHCESAIDEAHDRLNWLVWQMAMGVKFKIDPSLVRLGYSGEDAYARGENGDFIEEGERQPNEKMMLYYLVWKRPETWGPPKRDICQTGGVHVVGGPTKTSENSYAASIRARKWKSMSKKVQEPKA